MKSFLEFVNEKRKNEILSESFSNSTISHACNIITSLLTKHIDKKLMEMPGFVINNVGEDKLYSKQYLVSNGNVGTESVFELNWKESDGHWMVYSIDFFNNSDILWKGYDTTALSIYTLGSSIVYFLPVIWTVVNSGNYNISKETAINLGRSVFNNSNKVKESAFYVGALKYSIYENLDVDVINEAFNIKVINEKNYGEDAEVASLMKNKRDELNKAKEEGDDELARTLNREYWTIQRAVKGGATTMQKLEMALHSNVKVRTNISADEANVTTEVNKINNNSQNYQAQISFSGKQEDNKFDLDLDKIVNKKYSIHDSFDRMCYYADLVVKGKGNALVIAGAPGLGKTYHVTKIIEAGNYNDMSKLEPVKDYDPEETPEHSLYVIKGIGSPAELYKKMYSFRKKSDLLVLDDCDSLISSNASEDAQALFKAAMDSGDDRQVSWAKSLTIQDSIKEDEKVIDRFVYPKSFDYNGKTIVITNNDISKLNAAMINRNTVINLDFTMAEVVDYLEEKAPEITRGSDCSMESCKFVIDFFRELANSTKYSNKRLSFRTFNQAIRIVEGNKTAQRWTDADLKYMIWEQVKKEADIK